MMLKICNHCNLEKNVLEFSPKGEGKYSTRCKACIAWLKKQKYVRHSKASRPAKIEGDFKQCKICNIILNINDFYKNKGCGSHRNECKKCIKQLNSNRSNKNRQFVFNCLKEHPCVDCGESDPIVLEFDHLRDKIDNVSSLIQSSSETVLLNEIEKCEIRCANCHRRKTAIQFNWYKDLIK